MAGVGEIELTENEWAKARTLADRYSLYVVFDCTTPRPRLVRIHHPFRNLLAKARGNMVIASTQVLKAPPPHETIGGAPSHQSATRR